MSTRITEYFAPTASRFVVLHGSQNDLDQYGSELGVITTRLDGFFPPAQPYRLILDDTNLYRSAANILKTDDSFHTVGNITANVGIGTQVTIGSVAANAGLTFGSSADTNLYRSGANALKTDDDFISTASLTVFIGNTGQIQVGAAGGTPLIYFGSALDTNLYRAAANALGTDDELRAVGDLYAGYGTAGQIRLIGGASATPQIILGSAGDVNLYRSSPDILSTDDAFRAALYLEANASSAAAVRIGRTAGGAADSSILFGSAFDTNLYRVAADTLKTDDNLQVSLDLWARIGAASQVAMGVMGPASEAGIVFGSAADVNLYRSGANTLKTDDSLHVVGDVILPVGGGVGTTRITSGTAFYNRLLLADANPSWRVMGSGLTEWGAGGASVPDTNLYRAAANELATDDEFFALRGAATQVRLGAISGKAALILGSAGDTSLYRAAADTLKTDDVLQTALYFEGTADGAIIFRTLSAAFVTANNVIFASRQTGEAQDRFQIGAQGRLTWGPGGSTAVDTNLFRSTADTLRTDDNFIVGGSLSHVGSTAGFFNTAAAAKQTVTGSRGGNAALASLLTALATYGLVTDSSTA